MDITQLSERTGLSVRLIRYVLDHKLVPPQHWFVDEHAVGRARVFDEFTGVFIACAACLLEAGYKRDSVREFLNSIGKVMPMGRNPLHHSILKNVVISRGAGRVQYGDGRYIRWQESQSSGEWLDSTTQPMKPSEVTPKVIVELNVSEIRDRVLGRK